jgi:hypothetical protein
MQSEGIRRHLWLRPSERRAEVFHKPDAPYILKVNERTIVVEIIQELKTLSNYVGAIHKCLEEGKLRYMKFHNFHVLMHEVHLQIIRNSVLVSDVLKLYDIQWVILAEGLS